MNGLLWYRQSAPNWFGALPVGNGRLGAMVFGRVQKEQIQLNEETLWTGHPAPRHNPDAAAGYRRVRELLLAGRGADAQFEAELSLLGIPQNQTSYQTMSNLQIIARDLDDKDASDYSRELDIATGIARTEFTVDGVRHRRDVFASSVHDVIVVQLSADRPGAVSVAARLWRKHDHDQTFALDDDAVRLDGRCGPYGVRYTTLLTARAHAGTTRLAGNHVVVEDADSATLMISCASDFRLGDAHPQEARRLLVAAAESDDDELLTAHAEAHRGWMGETVIDLAGTPAEVAALPTDRRLELLKSGGDDPDLVALYVAYGRYLLQASSRPGGLPANLQGIWNDSISPAWDAKYTININTEMNYWPAEVAGLSRAHEPLFDLVDRVRVSGAETARLYYGARGFTAHHNVDLWADTVPLDNVWCGVWPMGGVWLSLHLWDHYEFTLNRVFLAERAYPVLRESAEFLLDFLEPDDRGLLLSGPSSSPENAYIDADGVRLALAMSPTMDVQLTRALFRRLLRAQAELGISDELGAEVAAALPRLPGHGIGRHGQLMEWLDDVEEAMPGHRHISHLFGLFPDDQLLEDPAVTIAARTTLERRIRDGGGGTGWSRAWIVAFWARLLDGDEAHRNLLRLLTESTEQNLFDTHPPQGTSPITAFQIDGNFGAVAAVCEMLLQSQGGRLRLLPALPAAWPEGSAVGLHARGGFAVDLRWAGGMLVSAEVTATVDGPAIVQLGHEHTELEVRDDRTIVAAGAGPLEWDAEAGATYRITRR